MSAGGALAACMALSIGGVEKLASADMPILRSKSVGESTPHAPDQQVRVCTIEQKREATGRRIDLVSEEGFQPPDPCGSLAFKAPRGPASGTSRAGQGSIGVRARTPVHTRVDVAVVVSTGPHATTPFLVVLAASWTAPGGSTLEHFDAQRG
jgi:hypothetical protein